MTRRGWLLRGESVVASTGLALAVILLASMATAAWWALRTNRQAVDSMNQKQADAVGTLLASSAESLLLADELSTVRRLIGDAARNNGFAECRLVLGDGQIIADADPSKITVARLPETWANLPEIPEIEGEGNLLRFPLEIPGRGSATVELSAPALGATWQPWEAQVGLGAIGTGCMLALLLIYRRMRARLRAMGAIREALLCKHAGETTFAALSVNAEPIGRRGQPAPEAVAWNELVAENERMHQQLLVTQIQNSRSSNGGSGMSDLENVCDAMWQGLLLVDNQMHITYANGAAAVLLRAKRDGMIGCEVSSITADDALLDPIRKVVDGTIRRRVTSEIKLVHKDADQKPAEGGEAPAHQAPGLEKCSILRFNVRPVRRGDTAAAMVIIEDVTQQRLAEDARNAFVAQATHELRMPLTNIRLYSESALDEGERDVAVRSKCLNVINQESKRLERIVGDMLSVAEIEAGTLKIRMGEVRLETLFDELNNDYQAQAKEKSVSLSFNLPPKLPAIKGDRDKIVLALHNLIGNAIKYTPSGGSVDVNVEVTDKQLVVDVVDTGIGIREEEAELIFQKFYRSKDERIAGMTGSGLGLAVARDVIRLHRGDIAVRSQINEGSTFTLMVPTLLEAA